MTVTSYTTPDQYNGNSATTAFTFNAGLLDVSHVKVTTLDTTNPAAVGVVKSLGADYTVSGVGGSSATVTFLVAPATGTRVTLERNVPLTQQTHYVADDSFPAESHEAALDKLTMIVQQQQAQINRTAALPSAASTALAVVLPVPIDQSLLMWSGTAGLLVNSPAITDITAVAAATANIDAVGAAIANVNTLAADLANIDIAATNVTSLVAVASNLTVIQSAPTNATTAQTSAATAVAAAATATAAAAVAAGSLMGTSVTSNTIGTGDLTFTTQTGLAIPATGGNFVTVSSTASPSNYVHGQVKSYNTSTGVVVVTSLDTDGAGTFASWNITPSSPQGTGASGSGTVNSGTGGRLAWYAATGTTLSGDANITAVLGALTLGQAASVQGSVVLSGATSGTTTLAAPAAGTGTMTLQAGTDTVVGRATTDTFTNKTFDTAGTGNHLKINGQAISAVSGNTTKVATVSGSLTTAHAAVFDASGNIIDGGVLGTAAALTAGTSANNAVKLDGSAKLPAVDGSALTNLPVTFAGYGEVGSYAFVKCSVSVTPGSTVAGSTLTPAQSGTWQNVSDVSGTTAALFLFQRIS